ncbi:hypothetical protein [Planococcus salinarum]|uniref:hypothetical protein n=1 Tax=Planococcus salinarum TaxID=622695 RepID=UPI000E3D297A|nr:hypothetical protein [Planococcus salinarum]TAA69211.1 hypothetical protein D2909_12945 [Planococcus salinarum]
MGIDKVLAKKTPFFNEFIHSLEGFVEICCEGNRRALIRGAKARKTASWRGIFDEEMALILFPEIYVR